MKETEQRNYINSAVRVLNGKYQDAIIKLQPMEELVVGRDVSCCHLVLEAPWVSRKHCIISYDYDKGKYKVVDTSENGTFVKGMERLQREQTQFFSADTIITIGEKGIELQLM